MAKYKVGDKVRVRKDLEEDIMYYMDDKSDYWYFYDDEMGTYLGAVVTIKGASKYFYTLEEDELGNEWADEMFEGLAEEKPAAPITVNLNINIDVYANACWHCRKGGIVDLYLNGRPGICPSCGRVCNGTTVKQIEVKPFTAPTVKEVKENKWLTNEELYALSDGTRVFTVKTTDGVEEPKDLFTCWRIVKRDDTNPKNTRLKRKNGFCYVSECNKDSGDSYHVYLEMPDGVVDSGA